VADAVTTPRERYREQVREEVKAHAWEQVATAGAPALSLNAIARQMGISGPALYRYFRNRDELITELVLDAYRDLLGTCQAAITSGEAPAARLTAMAAALRGWALAAPHRYLLIYGTPVPGHHAPPEATALAASLMQILLDAFTDALADTGPSSGTRSSGGAGSPGGTAALLDAHLGTDHLGAGYIEVNQIGTPHSQPRHHEAQHHEVQQPGTQQPGTQQPGTQRPWAAGNPAPAAAKRHALTFWTRLHGVLSLEVAGHFTDMGFDPALLYAAETEAILTMP
jgi:AcrR family transcriptional regulator